MHTGRPRLIGRPGLCCGRGACSKVAQRVHCPRPDGRGDRNRRCRAARCAAAPRGACAAACVISGCAAALEHDVHHQGHLAGRGGGERRSEAARGACVRRSSGWRRDQVVQGLRLGQGQDVGHAAAGGEAGGWGVAAGVSCGQRAGGWQGRCVQGPQDEQVELGGRCRGGRTWQQGTSLGVCAMHQARQAMHAHAHAPGMASKAEGTETSASSSWRTMRASSSRSRSCWCCCRLGCACWPKAPGGCVKCRM